MTSNVKTLWGIDLDLANYKKINYKPLPNTTLNEKFEILTDVDNMAVDNPTLKGYCIGNGNIKTIGSDSETVLYYGNHKVSDGALYNHIPFIIRTLNNDLSITERAKYRLRKEHTVDGVIYAAYYMKIIDDISIDNQLLIIETVDGERPKINEFNTNDSSILNPTPVEYTNEIIDIGLTYMAISDQISFVLTLEELAEIKEAMSILGLDDNGSFMINEMAICSGTDVVDASTYTTESAYTQVNLFVDLDYDIEILINEEKGFYREVELGGMEPLTIR